MVWAVSLSTTKLSPRSLTPEWIMKNSEFVWVWSLAQPKLIQCSTSSCDRIPGYTYIYFEENQLFPGSISISPLSTSHPRTLQRSMVRASIWFYPNFTLLMDRSPAFGSSMHNYSALKASLSLRLRGYPLSLLYIANSLAHSTKGTPSPCLALLNT